MAHAKSKVRAFVMKAFGVLTLEMVRPAGHDVVVFSQGSSTRLLTDFTNIG